MLEILSTILDFLPVPDLIRFARVSKRMKEMVYDDTRWVQRLQLMGCWDEGAARKRAEAARRERSESQKILYEEEAKRAGIGVNGTVPGSDGPNERSRGASVTLFDAALEAGKRPVAVPDNVTDGFDAIVLSSGRPRDANPPYNPMDNALKLKIFSQSRSVRGFGREEYGKVHGALAPLYNDALRSRTHTDAFVFRTYRDPDQQAQMLSNLVRFANSDTAQGWQQREHKVRDLVKAFETAVSREFEHGLVDGDIEGKIRKYAHVLGSLNGGQKAVDMFLSRTRILSDKRSLGNPMDCLDEKTLGTVSLEWAHRFFSNLSAAFNEQVTIVDRVFPTSVGVVIPFLEKIGKEVISDYLTILFDEAHRMGVDSYLKSVSTTYEQSLDFAKSLRPTNESGDEFYETVDQVIANIFEPHIDLYLKEELKFFKERSESQVGEWERQLSEQDASMTTMYMSNVNRQADKKDFLTSFKKVVMMPVNVLPTFPISSPFSGKPATAKALVNGETLETLKPPGSQGPTRPSTPGIVNGTALSINRASTPLQEPPTTELAAKAAIMASRLEGICSLFSIEVALNLVHAAKSSIERAAVFVKLGGQYGIDARKQCELIFILLLQILGSRHIKSGFDQAVDHLSKYKPREASEHGQSGVTPLVTFLELVNVGDLIQQMVDVFYEQELISKKLTNRDDFLDPAVKEKKRFEQMLDERVAAGLNKGIEVLMAEVEYICATTQKPEDYNPGASSGTNFEVMDIGPTKTALKIVEVVSSHTKMLVGSTDKNMLDVFNQEVGLRLFTALCKHLKMQRISVNGSIKLIRFFLPCPFSFPFCRTD
jgi:recyclin-1